jgi:hypothetical protein
MFSSKGLYPTYISYCNCLWNLACQSCNSSPLFLSIRFTEFRIWNLWECFLAQRMRSMLLVFIPLPEEVLSMEPRCAPFSDHVHLINLYFWTA